MDLLDKLKNRGNYFIMWVGLFFIAAIGYMDYITGYELAFSLFYLFPISLVAWLTSKRFGIATAALSAAVWLAADITAGTLYSSPLIYAWNTIIRFSFFIIVVFLLSALRTSLEREQELARNDPLTGAVNSRFFPELIQAEIERLNRFQRPFSLIYLDLDNFKTINDQFGHAAGDRTLRSIVDSAKIHLRTMDMIARLGGDEFALLLPETGELVLRTVVEKIQHLVLKDVKAGAPAITLSIGALTCIQAPHSADEIISMADQLMYSAKTHGKNAAAFGIYAGRLMAENPRLVPSDRAFQIPSAQSGEPHE